ncbi:MAG: thiamine pyrophosphate-dependent dehydrogenase E1 component subunit alpha [Acidobacteria bacterium]|nr:thiamine pyrophosphate-dependent dehydrogenase E1 component subunit alpha [Acidobacteriota bacterium]
MDLAKKWPLTRQQHHDMYYYMVLNRGVEDQMVRMFRQNKILSGIYQSLGQESISVGNAFALESNDWLAPMIRNIGALLVKGFSVEDIFTQHMARLTAPTKGKDSTSHFGDYKKRVVGPISMLGDLIPVMCGVAMAGRYLGQNIVALTWIGDGGSSTGAFHEGMGLAASQRAPLIVVIENNQWAYSTPVRRQVPLENLADRAKAYGIPSLIVDGNDVVAVYATTKEAVAIARAGEGPVIIEAKTMRMKGHAQHDPAEYVPKEMFEHWKARDPITRFGKYLTENKLWTEADRKVIHARVEKEVAAGAQAAEEAPLPPPEMAMEGVYCDGPRCHDMTPEWKRPIEEVTPPRASVKAEWIADRLSNLANWSGGNGASAKAASRTSSTTNGKDGKRAPEKNEKNEKNAKPARAMAKSGKGKK